MYVTTIPAEHWLEVRHRASGEVFRVSARLAAIDEGRVRVTIDAAESEFEVVRPAHARPRARRALRHRIGERSP